MALLPSWDVQDYQRVLKLASKPSGEEMKVVAGGAGAGLVLVGFIGFAIFALMSLIPV
jgi:protein transport protein SEC61 subunit gamma-like protein